MKNNKLLLNDDKTEAIPIGTCQNLTQLTCSKSTVLPFLTKNLDVVLDNTMSMHQFVSHIAKSFYSQLHCISQI